MNSESNSTTNVLESLFDFHWLRLDRKNRIELGSALGASRALLIAALARDRNSPVIVVVPDQRAMEELEAELHFFGLGRGEDFWSLSDGDARKSTLLPVFTFPHLETLPYENKSPEHHLKSDRFRIFEILVDLSTEQRRILPDRKLVVIAPVRSFMARVPDLARHRSTQWILRPGSELDRDEFAGFLLDEGYDAVEFIADRGQFSIRGGVLDIFPFTQSEPIRIELFGDDIDSMRSFDLLSQRSVRSLEELVIGATDEFRLIVSEWGKNRSLPGIADFVPADAVIVWDSPELIREESKRVFSLVEKMHSERLFLEESDDVPEENPLLEIPPQDFYGDYEQVLQELDSRDWIEISEFALEESDSSTRKNLPIGRPNLSGIDVKMRVQEILERARHEERFYLVCDNEGQKERLSDLLLDLEKAKKDNASPDSMRRAILERERLAERYARKPSIRKKADSQTVRIQGIDIVLGIVRQGFRCLETNQTLVSGEEIFGRIRRVRSRRKSTIGVPIVDLVDLQTGNYVVHIDHGIGRFVGLKRLQVGGREGEFLELRYADEDVIYVPIEQIDRVSRYVGTDDSPPKLSKVGGKLWQSAKARAKKAIEDLSGQLLDLYADRQVREGFRYPSDTPWQHEFEAAFPYEETPDQWKAVEDVKKDMESAHCMDRLICGDVGFGKTEVAMRAAFKAVCEGKQVALLAPTTVLVEQHFETFATRMAEYPVTIETLSRFRSASDAKSILRKAAEGEIDVLIGTHRIIQKDVRFKDLGLVVIDEEQRFGVKHKEKFKQLRKRVDVLTLSATPIPRTLYMSMSGVRDMSLVNTPPKDRLPVETYVVEYKPEIAESAILRELARGGQVFFLHNRVESIYGMGDMLQEIVPEARLAVAHGQMEGRQLEKVMRRFISGEVDVLVSTTIIESGLDIPNANTILINRSDTFGLSELYQLRGRVGRANHQAYCYLMVPSKQSLSPVARQRLLALQEHTALGSGFQIAMRDLEIRGMGNILGREQHGHIAAIGFDLYSSLLAKTIKLMKGELTDEDSAVVIDTYRTGEFPQEYIPSGRQRMSIHKRMAAIQKREDRESLREEIVDLYGRLPEMVELLFANLELKERARQASFDHVRVRPSGARLRFTERASQEFNPELVLDLERERPGKIRLSSAKDRIYLEVSEPADQEDWEAWLDTLLRMISKRTDGGRLLGHEKTEEVSMDAASDC